MPYEEVSQFHVDKTTTLGTLKAMVISASDLVNLMKVSDLKAWYNGTPLLDDSMTLYDYNLDDDSAEISFGRDWPENVLSVLDLYTSPGRT